MAKFYGLIGYAETVETKPGIWEEVFTERPYYGDVNRISRRLQTSDGVNDDVILNEEISIIADPYADQNFYAMRYAVYKGTKWKITDVSIQYPRLILSLGGIYNGPTA